MLECKICGYLGKQLHQHVMYKHNMTSSQYKQEYGDCKMQLVDLERERNTMSIFMYKYWMTQGYSEADAKVKVSEVQRNNNRKRKYNKRDLLLCKEYWIERYNYTEDQAIIKIKEIQADRSARSTKFKGKRHTADTKRRISENMSKHIQTVGINTWVSHFGDQTTGISKVEIECFLELKQHYNMLQSNVAIGPYIVDMLLENKVIEFNGCYWHADPKYYLPTDILHFPSKTTTAADIWKNESIRTEYLKQQGYDVYIIWEDEWRFNKTKVISEIQQYLS